MGSSTEKGQREERRGRKREAKERRALDRIFLHLIKGYAMVNTSSEAYWDMEGDPDSIVP